MRTYIRAAFAAAGLVCLLAGCAGEPVQPTPPPASAAVMPEAVPTAEPPLDERALSIPVPDFLDAEQQDLYRRAYTMYSHLFGGETFAVEDFPQADGTQPEFRTYETVEIEGTTYYLAQGRYRNWSDFEAAVDGLFTDAFWTARNEGEGGPIYTQLDGRLCLRDLSKGADLSRNDFFPDTFRLLEAGEEEISFLLIGYYSDETAPLEGESPAERDARLAAGYDETREYPICMVHTAQGWRFERFYTTWSDEPPEAA